jgi:uncharacterized protein (DUF433 family)
MTAREIVRDPHVLGGRWHFAGTTVAVADVRVSLGDGEPSRRADAREIFTAAGLSEADVQAASDFAFPEVRGLNVVVQFTSLTVECPCGEATSKATIGPGTTIVACPCRRRWRIIVEAEPDGA